MMDYFNSVWLQKAQKVICLLLCGYGSSCMAAQNIHFDVDNLTPYYMKVELAYPETIRYGRYGEYIQKARDAINWCWKGKTDSNNDYHRLISGLVFSPMTMSHPGIRLTNDNNSRAGVTCHNKAKTAVFKVSFEIPTGSRSKGSKHHNKPILIFTSHIPSAPNEENGILWDWVNDNGLWHGPFRTDLSALYPQCFINNVYQKDCFPGHPDGDAFHAFHAPKTYRKSGAWGYASFLQPDYGITTTDHQYESTFQPPADISELAAEEPDIICGLGKDYDGTGQGILSRSCRFPQLHITCNVNDKIDGRGHTNSFIKCFNDVQITAQTGYAFIRGESKNREAVYTLTNNRPSSRNIEDDREKAIILDNLTFIGEDSHTFRFSHGNSSELKYPDNLPMENRHGLCREEQMLLPEQNCDVIISKDSFVAADAERKIRVHFSNHVAMGQEQNQVYSDIPVEFEGSALVVKQTPGGPAVEHVSVSTLNSDHQIILRNNGPFTMRLDTLVNQGRNNAWLLPELPDTAETGRCHKKLTLAPGDECKVAYRVITGRENYAPQQLRVTGSGIKNGFFSWEALPILSPHVIVAYNPASLTQHLTYKHIDLENPSDSPITINRLSVTFPNGPSYLVRLCSQNLRACDFHSTCGTPPFEIPASGSCHLVLQALSTGFANQDHLGSRFWNLQVSMDETVPSGDYGTITKLFPLTYSKKLYFISTTPDVDETDYTLAVYDGTTPLSVPVTGLGRTHDRINALHMYKGDLYLAGYFNFIHVGASEYTPIVRGRSLLRWNGRVFSSLHECTKESDHVTCHADQQFNGEIKALAVYNGKLAIGGTFTKLLDISSGFFGRSRTFNHVAFYSIENEPVQESSHTLASFSPLGSATVNGVTGNESPGNPTSVNALTLFSNKLVLGGSFTSTSENNAARRTMLHDVAFWSYKSKDFQGIKADQSGQTNGFEFLNRQGIFPVVNAITLWNYRLIFAGNIPGARTGLNSIFRWTQYHYFQPLPTRTTLPYSTSQNILASYDNKLFIGGSDTNRLTFYSYDHQRTEPYQLESIHQPVDSTFSRILGLQTIGDKLYVSGRIKPSLFSWDGQSVNVINQIGSISLLTPVTSLSIGQPAN